MSNYVDNERLYQNICAWKQEIREKGHHVKMPDSIGVDILKIARGFTGYWKFSGYTQVWKELMVSDAVEAVIKGLINFDETRYRNPHAYITKACFNAFINRIKFERAEMAKKYKFFLTHVYDSSDDDMAQVANEDFIQDIHDKLTSYEKSVKPSKKAHTDNHPTLEDFYEIDNENETDFESEPNP